MANFGLTSQYKLFLLIRFYRLFLFSKWYSSLLFLSCGLKVIDYSDVVVDMEPVELCDVLLAFKHSSRVFDFDDEFDWYLVVYRYSMKSLRIKVSRLTMTSNRTSDGNTRHQRGKARAQPPAFVAEPELSLAPHRVGAQSTSTAPEDSSASV